VIRRALIGVVTASVMAGLFSLYYSERFSVRLYIPPDCKDIILIPTGGVVAMTKLRKTPLAECIIVIGDAPDKNISVSAINFAKWEKRLHTSLRHFRIWLNGSSNLFWIRRIKEILALFLQYYLSHNLQRDIIGRGGSNVLQKNVPNTIAVSNETPHAKRSDRQIRAVPPFGRDFVDFVGIDCSVGSSKRSLGRLLGLIGHCIGMEGCISGPVQSAPKHYESNSREKRSDGCGNGCNLCPEPHTLLGIKIAASVLLFIGGIVLCFYAFSRSGYALDAVLERRKGAVIEFWLFVTLLLCSAFFAVSPLLIWFD